jgi:hypothetical protein
MHEIKTKVIDRDTARTRRPASNLASVEVAQRCTCKPGKLSAGDNNGSFESTLSRIVEMCPALPPCTGSLACRGEKRADSQTTNSGGRNRTLHLLAVPAGNRTLVLANAETYPTRYRARCVLHAI